MLRDWVRAKHMGAYGPPGISARVSRYVSLRNHSPGQIGCEDAHVYVASPKAAKHRVRATVGWCFEGGELFPGASWSCFRIVPRGEINWAAAKTWPEVAERIHSLQPSE